MLKGFACYRVFIAEAEIPVKGRAGDRKGEEGQAKPRVHPCCLEALQLGTGGWLVVLKGEKKVIV